MVRGLLVALLVTALAIAVLMIPPWLSTDPGSGAGEEAASQCHPLQNPCRWTTPEGKAVLTMERPGGDELLMNVTLPGVSGPVIVVLTGESMYMGEYPLRLETTSEPHGFRARFVPPFCSTGDDMVWRVNLRVGTEAVETPFRILFRASAN